MSPTDQLVEAIRQIPGQLAADLVLGLPLVLFALLVLLYGARRRSGSRW